MKVFGLPKFLVAVAPLLLLWVHFVACQDVATDSALSEAALVVEKVEPLSEVSPPSSRSSSSSSSGSTQKEQEQVQLNVRKPVNVPHPIYPIAVKSSPVHGRGVFATQDIKNGSLVELVPLITPLESEHLDSESLLWDYVLNRDDHLVVMLGYGSLYNHHDEPNVYWDWDDDEPDWVRYMANRDIQKGEELYVSYGSGYWTSRTTNSE